MKNKILIAYDRRDFFKEEERSIVERIEAQLRGELSSYDIETARIEINPERENIKLDIKKVQQLKLAVKESLITVIIISNQSIESPELEQLFKDVDENEIIFSFNYRASGLNSNWIEQTYIYPNSDFPYLDQSVSEKYNTLKGLTTNLKELLDVIPKPEISSKPPEDVRQSSPFSVFISYNHKDGDFADLLKHKLEEAEIEVFIDIALAPGKEWKPSIDYNIEKSNLILLVLSPRSKASEYVIYEWSYALAKGKGIFPIIIEKTENLHPKLKDLQNIYFNDRTNRDWDDLIRKVLAYKESLDNNEETV